MIKKTYVSRYSKFSIGITISGKKEEVKFNVRDVETGGVKYITSKTDIQEALEVSPAFKVHFKLDVTEEIPDMEVVEVVEEIEEIEETIAEEVPLDTEPVQAIESETIPEAIADQEPTTPEVQEFKTVQDAKTWLNKEKGIAMNKMLNSKQVDAEAKAIGISIVYNK